MNTEKAVAFPKPDNDKPSIVKLGFIRITSVIASPLNFLYLVNIVLPRYVYYELIDQNVVGNPNL